MRLYGQRVFVNDLRAARRFYHDVLGLPIAWEHEVAIGRGCASGTSLARARGLQPLLKFRASSGA